MKVPQVLERLLPHTGKLLGIMLLAIVLLAISSHLLTGPNAAEYVTKPALITYLEPWQKVAFFVLAFGGGGYCWFIAMAGLGRRG